MIVDFWNIDFISVMRFIWLVNILY